MRPSLSISALLASLTSALLIVAAWFAASAFDKRPSTILLIHRVGILPKETALEWLLSDLSGEHHYPIDVTREALTKLDSRWSTLPPVAAIHRKWVASIESTSATENQKAITGEINLAQDLPEAGLTILALQLKPGNWLYSNTSAKNLSPFVQDQLKGYARQCDPQLITSLKEALDSADPQRIKKSCDSIELLFEHFCPSLSDSLVPQLLSSRAEINKPVFDLYHKRNTELVNAALSSKTLTMIISNLLCASESKEWADRVQLAHKVSLIATNASAPYLELIPSLPLSQQANAWHALRTLLTLDRASAQAAMSGLMDTDSRSLNLERLTVVKEAATFDIDPPARAFACLGDSSLQPTALETFNRLVPSYATNWVAYERDFLRPSWEAFYKGTNSNPFSPIPTFQDRIERSLMARSKSSTNKFGGCIDFVCLDDSQAEQLGYIPKECMFVLFPNSTGELFFSNPRSRSNNVSVAFSADDIRNLDLLASRINKKQDAASAFVNEQLTSDARTALSTFYPAAEDSTQLAGLRMALARNLNNTIHGPLIYESPRFQNIQLGVETQKLLAQKRSGKDLIRLNGLLLQDAYPSQLVLSKDSTLSVRDFRGFTAKLRESSDPLSAWLWEQLDDALRKALPRDTRPMLERQTELRSSLVSIFNAILKNQEFYTPNRFRGVELRSTTSRLRYQGPTGEDLPRLNRLLLEDAFPAELARKAELVKEQETSAPWPYTRARFIRLSSGWVRLASLDTQVQKPEHELNTFGVEQLALITNDVPFFSVFFTASSLQESRNFTSTLWGQIEKAMSIREWSWPRREFHSVLFLPLERNRGRNSSSEMSYSVFFALMGGCEHPELKKYVALFDSERIRDATWIERTGVATTLNVIAEIEPSAGEILRRMAKEDASLHVKRVAEHALAAPTQTRN